MPSVNTGLRDSLGISELILIPKLLWVLRLVFFCNPPALICNFEESHVINTLIVVVVWGFTITIKKEVNFQFQSPSIMLRGEGLYGLLLTRIKMIKVLRNNF